MLSRDGKIYLLERQIYWKVLRGNLTYLIKTQQYRFDSIINVGDG